MTDTANKTESATQMAKAYEPQTTEQRVYHFWESRGYFKGVRDPDNKRPPFSVVMPPPNITGELHLGHAMMDTVEDILIRWHRMQGDPTLWLPGIDHAGIATQTAVEKMLAKEGISRHDLGRDEFEQKVWEWVRRFRPIISDQHRRLGASADWSREVFTLDDGPQSAVRTVFKKMFDENLIYRGERLINWCPRCLSALSDLEVEHDEAQGSLWYLRYPVVEVGDGGRAPSPVAAATDGDVAQPPPAVSAATNVGAEEPRLTGEYIIVATTRPETYLGDTGVAVNPKDDRYKALIGRSVMLPVIQRVIPVVGDDAVEMEFGTGAVKVTPGHDPTDFEIGQRNNLPIINIMNEDASINENGGPYAGMDRYDARAKIVRDLEELGYLEKTEPYALQASVCYRCRTVIEPLMSWQWFVNQRTLAEPAIDAVKDGRVTFVPERFERMYLNWMENIRDWCISRQLWWGHRIPVWYSADEDGDRIMVKLPQDIVEHANSPPPVGKGPGVRAQHGTDGKPPPTIAATYNEFRARGVSHETIARHGTWVGARRDGNLQHRNADAVTDRGGNLLQETDVLDTWFSSGLWPFSTLGWPQENDELSYWYPTSVMETGYDIIYLWVARMIMLGLYCRGEVPFSTVYLHGTVRNAEGKRMSKSLGTGIDPIETIDKYGADALRYTLITAGAAGNDLKLSDQKLEQGRNFANKLWNATRFVISMIGDEKVDVAPLAAALAANDRVTLDGLPVEDRWILSRIEELSRSADTLMQKFDLGEAARQAYDFAYNEFADWYIEIAKVRARGVAQPSPAVSVEASAAGQRTSGSTAEDGHATSPSPLPVLAYVLDRTLRLLHPTMPFLTEELWQNLQRAITGFDDEALIVATFPKGESGYSDPIAEKQMELLIDVVRAIRNIRAEKKVEPGKYVEAYIVAGDTSTMFEAAKPYVEMLARARPLHIVASAADAPREQVATAVLEGATAVVPLAGLFDTAGERARIRKQIADAETELGRLEAKLSNEGFRAKAPEKVIAAEEERLAGLRTRLDGLRVTLAELG